MGFKSRYQYQSCYSGTIPGRRFNRQRYMQSTRETHKWFWRPVVPSWEKEFCLKIGSFRWENFLDYKKHTYYHCEKILNWNDSGSEEAFHHAKNRFYAEFHNIPFVDSFKPNPNLYIDEIDWNQEIDSKLVEELELALMTVEEDLIASILKRSDETQIEEIIPTGWDADCLDKWKWNILTGLIVGDHSSCREGVPQV